MPDLVEKMYCSQQITIPPNLPTILKKYAKAAIRTQPKDLLVWSAAYFKALSYAIPLPVKERLEWPPVQTISGLSPGFIKVLINQVGNDVVKVPKTDVIDHWSGVCLSREALDEIFAVGGFSAQINWLKFIAICAGYLETSLTRTMILLCELLTSEPAGGSAYLPVDKFIYLYKFLARLDCGPEEPKKISSTKSGEESDQSDTWTEEGISYKEESSIKSGSMISWKSVLKRMGKRESDQSTTTVDLDKVYNKKDYLSRGIAWKQITEMEETSEERSVSFYNDRMDSRMGLQVYECHEDKVKQLRKLRQGASEERVGKEGEWEEEEREEVREGQEKRDQKEGEEIVRERQGEMEEEIVDEDEEREVVEERRRTDEENYQYRINKSSAIVDFTEEIGQRSLNEMLKYLEEFEMTKEIRAAAESSSDDVKLSDTSEYDKKEHECVTNAKRILEVTPAQMETSQRFMGEARQRDQKKKDYEIKELLKPDSSTILVPTPKRGEDEDSDSIEDIKELEDETFSIGQPLKKQQAASLFDVRVPQINIPNLIKVAEEDVPKIQVVEQKWANIPGIGPKVSQLQVKEVEDYMRECASRQCGVVMPRNIRHFQCPPLDLQEQLQQRSLSAIV